MSIEYRSFTSEPVEATDEGHVFGLAIPYNRETTIGNMDHGGFREQIAPGACSKSMREADIVALNNHNSWQPLGRTSAGNLSLNSTARGVEPDLKPIDTSYGSDLLKNVKAKIIRGWSFGFEVIKDDWTSDDGQPSDEWTGTNRTIREMKLVEVSPVTFPAYEMTEISSRSGLLAERETRLDQSHQDSASAPVRPAPEVTDPPETGDERAGSAPYGKVSYADPGYLDSNGKNIGTGGQKRYPLDSKKHAQAAYAYISVAANASQYTKSQLATVKGAIVAACKKFGISISEKNEAELAEEWRQAIEAKKARKAGKRAKSAQVTLKMHCVNCGGALRCLSCSPIPKTGDPNIEGGEHGVSGDVTSQNSADPGDETRAAKATYSDVDTCGDCGATSQYGAYCSNCGKPMAQNAQAGSYCPACGAKVKGKREDHVCDETRGKNNTSNLVPGTEKRIPQIAADLGQALKLFSGADIDSLPKDIQQAIALVSSAATHAGHIQDHEGLAPKDAISAKNAKGRSADPKPDESTSEDFPDDDALRIAYFDTLSREFDMGHESE